MTRRWAACLLLVSLLSPGPPASAECGQKLPSGLADWSVLHLDFESESLQAATPSGPRAPQTVRGRVALAPGRYGSALRLGGGADGGEAVFAAPGSLDLSRPGSLSFWVSPTSWESPSSSYVRLFLVGGVGGPTFNIQRDYRRQNARGELFLMGLFGLPEGNYFLHLETEDWVPSSWHLLAVRWDRVSFGVSIDGGEFVQQGVPGDVWRRAFANSGKGIWLIGDGGGQGTLIDELHIFARPLSASENRAMFESEPDGRCGTATRGGETPIRTLARPGEDDRTGPGS